MADQRDSLAEQKSNIVTISDSEEDENITKTEEAVQQRKRNKDTKRITDMDCDTKWVTDLWNCKNTGSGKTSVEEEYSSGVGFEPGSDAKPAASIRKQEGEETVSKNLSRRPLLAKLPRSYKSFMFLKVKNACHYQVKIHGVPPRDLQMHTLLEATSFAEGMNYTASKWSGHKYRRTYERTLDIMAEKDKLQEIMQKVLFCPYSCSVVGFEIWRRDTSGSGITAEMDDEALVTEKVFFLLKNSHLRRTVGKNQKLKGNDLSRSVYLRNLPLTVDEFLLRCVFPFAVQIIVWKVSENTKSAVIQTSSPTNVRDCLISYTDMEINGRSISMSANDYTQTDAVTGWEKENLKMLTIFKSFLSNFKPGISELHGACEPLAQQEKREEGGGGIEKDAKDSKPASQQEKIKADTSDIEKSAKQKSKEEEAEISFQQCEKSRKPEARREGNAKAAKLGSDAKNSDQTWREDKPKKAASLEQNQEVRTIEESISRLKKSIKPVSQEKSKTVIQMTPRGDVSSQVSSVLKQIKVGAKLAPRSSLESHGQPVALGSASAQLSECVSSVLQQIKSGKIHKPATVEIQKEIAASTAAPEASKSGVEQQQQVHRASEEHPSPLSAGAGVAQVQVAKTASQSVPDNKGKLEAHASERTPSATRTSEKFLGETSSLEPAKIRSAQKEQHGQSFDAEVIDLTSLGTGKADKWQKLLPAEAVRQMEKERQDQEKREREKREALDREKRREEERKQLKRKREEEREMQKKRVLDRKQKPSPNQNKSGRKTGGTPRAAANTINKLSDFGRFSNYEQFIRSEEPVREGGFEDFQSLLVGHADELELPWFEQGLSDRGTLHHHDRMQSAAGSQLPGRDHGMAAASADLTAFPDHLVIVNALEQTVAQGLTVDETCTLLVNQLWQRGMPRQEAVIRVQQALASARERHLANQSLDAQLNDLLALPATRGTGHEERGLLGPGPGGFDRIGDFTFSPYDFQSSAAARSDVFPASTSSQKPGFASSGLEKSHAQNLNIPERSGHGSSAWKRFDTRELDVQDLDVREATLRGRPEILPAVEVGSQQDRSRYGLHELNKRDARDRGLQNLHASDGAMWGGGDRFPAGMGILPEPAAPGALRLDRVLARPPGPQNLDAGAPATQVTQVGQAVELRVIKDQLQRQVREQAERLQQQIAMLESMERNPDSMEVDESLLQSFQDQEHRDVMKASRPGNEQNRPDFSRRENTERTQQRTEKQLHSMFEEYEKELHHRQQAQHPDRHQKPELSGRGLLEEPQVPSKRYDRQPWKEEEMPQLAQRKHQEQGEWFWQHRMQGEGLETRGRQAQPETRDDVMDVRGQRPRQEAVQMRDARAGQPRQEGRMDSLDARGQRPGQEGRMYPLDARGQQPGQEGRMHPVDTRGQRPGQEGRMHPVDTRGQRPGQEGRIDARVQQPRQERMDPLDARGQRGQKETYAYIEGRMDKRYMDSSMKRDPSGHQGARQGGY